MFGKEIGGDIANNKKTWLLITALNEAPEQITPLLGNKLDREEKVACVTKIYRSLGLDRRCDELAARYAEDAIAAIDGLANVRYRPGFLQIARHKRRYPQPLI